ncbi:MAG: MSHA biogenesis protein MshK [Massilia sp.]|nr:MSHA biogenesis protein MshK [Massilia sp.]
MVTTRLLAVLLCSLAGLCGAQALSDPTRPPAQLAPAPLSGGASAPAPLGSTRPTLQSVLIARGPGGRRVAVIDGQTVRVGEKFKGAVLTGVSDNQAVLRRGSERQVLRLYPAPGTPAEQLPSPR